MRDCYHLNKKQFGTFNMNLLEFGANSLKFDAKPFNLITIWK